MRRDFSRFILVYIAVGVSSCASLWPFGVHKEAPTSGAAEKQVSEKQVSEKQSAMESSATTPAHQEKQDASAQVAPAVVAPAAVSRQDDESSLKMARMTARMDDIESELKKQREKIRLLEQGLLTGIAPDDLKKGKSSKKLSADEAADDSGPKSKFEDLSSPGMTPRKTKLTNAELPDMELPKPDLTKTDIEGHGGSGVAALPAPAGGNNEAAVSAKMRIAKEHYQAGRFGMSIAELAGVTREFGDKAAEGEARVWLGKSYLGLKEYGTARGEFEAYLSAWPAGAHAAAARLDLAKVFVGLGLKERARGELRKVIKEHEGDEFAEMASLELKNMQGSL